jgi:prolyl oligopeptidase
MAEADSSERFLALGALALFGALVSIPFAAESARTIAYPSARAGAVVDDYHGTRVADPYRWLEDTGSPETAAWIRAENALTASFLSDVPARAQIKARLTQLWDFERWDVPEREGERYFFTRNKGLENQSVLYWTDSLEGEPRVLLDPNALSKDGTVALAGTQVSDDGKLLAYGLSRAGSDWQEWRVRDVATARDLPDLLQWIKFSGASWTKDGKGFYYSRYDEPKSGEELKGANHYQKLCYHKIGTPQSEDAIVCRDDVHKEWGFSGQVSEDGKFLIISVWKSSDSKNQVFFKSLTHEESPILELIKGFEHGWDFLGNEGSVFFFRTDDAAPRSRVVAIDTRGFASGGVAPVREVVPEAQEAIQGVSLVHDQLLVSYLKDAHSLVRAFDLSGKLVRTVELPGLGTASGFGGKKTDKETFFEYTDYTTPPVVYRLDLETGKSTVWRRPTVNFDLTAFESRQVFYDSKDGTKVPLTIVSKKNLPLDGKNPTLLYGYGGFNDSETPWFSKSTIVWLEMGGVYAVANIRGGGEYGEPWHRSGMKAHKQNVFDDFIAGAEWLIAHGYTRSSRLAIEGASNGGLLVGACVTQRPDLFGAALAQVGVLDMLRFHKFTIGWAWIDEYGSSDDPEEFRFLRAYSPYHNVKPGTRYPAVLVATADHDDRVFPAHSFKFAAALQAAQAGPAPILVRIETDAGHGAGTPVSKEIDEVADKFAFLSAVLRMDGGQ